MLRSILSGSVLVAASILTPGQMYALPAPDIVNVSGTLHGIRIALFLPQRTYPMNALLIATISVTNVGKVDRFLPDWPPDWGGEFSPHVRMRTATGRLVYQEELSTFVTPTPGSRPDTYILHPGRSLTRHVRFVLQAPQLQAIVLVANGYISFTGSGHPPMASQVWHIASRFGSVTLTHEAPPAVKVTNSSKAVTATFHPQRGVTGRAFYMDSSYCNSGGGTGWTDQHVPWEIAVPNHISLSFYRYCKTKQWWHAVIGWPNHAVAFVRYVKH